MTDSVFFEVQFLFLLATSVLIPSGIYAFLVITRSISRWTVLFLGVVLIALSGIDVVLLQALAGMARATPSALDDRLFATELSITLYLLPAVFAGLGVNLVSHVLTSHLVEAERKFDRGAIRRPASPASGGPP